MHMLILIVYPTLRSDNEFTKLRYIFSIIRTIGDGV